MLARLAQPFASSLILVALACCSAPPASPPPAAGPAATAPAAHKPAINWDAAKAHVGETLTVVGPVIGTHTTNDQDSFVLNVGKDFPDAARFTIFCPMPKDAPAPDTLYKGKLVSVTGEIVLYRDVPEIKTEAGKIVILK